MSEDRASSNIPKDFEINLLKQLHFGAIVSISPDCNHGTQGFLYSEGFIVRGVVYQDFKNTNNDFCGSLFRVVPGYQFEVQKSMQKGTENLEDPLSSKNKSLFVIWLISLNFLFHILFLIYQPIECMIMKK